ncbi:SDR family NAD(P)-dependent oxidoreductase [Microbacterium sp. Se5.02b]|uniref:SDR family NAD(P)-dependent oxidoreductase n=1 Tax=Microbacterium sp. Se5.02b TaxID=2864103 RepID=UPI00215D954C|nr:SDR family NAD(P)-dependent oxidoreductase [Microbacterium sp. Se5.02b]
MRFIGRTAMITGAARGIGRASALRLASEGARVAIVDLDRHAAVDAAAAITRTAPVRAAGDSRSGSVRT